MGLQPFQKIGGGDRAKKHNIMRFFVRFSHFASFCSAFVLRTGFWAPHSHVLTVFLLSSLHFKFISYIIHFTSSHHTYHFLAGIFILTQFIAKWKLLPAWMTMCWFIHSVFWICATVCGGMTLTAKQFPDLVVMSCRLLLVHVSTTRMSRQFLSQRKCMQVNFDTVRRFLKLALAYLASCS
jgi:hypothetical protein